MKLIYSVISLTMCLYFIQVSAIVYRKQYWKRMCDGIEEVTDNSTCKDGVWKNPCGKLACLVGVAGQCDDHRYSFRYGKCADGLLCNCGKCQGCLKGECYSVLFCSRQGQYAKRMNNYPIEYANNYNEY